MRVRAALLCLALAGAAGCSRSSPPSAPTSSTPPATAAGQAGPSPTPVAGHPRLWVRADDVPRLRERATDANPLWRDGLAVLAETAKQEMDDGTVAKGDTGSRVYVDSPSEMYAELFAFLSLVSREQAQRDDYARRARTLLMRVIDEAAKGKAAEDTPFRDPDFALSDRSRWHGEAFALTVDWIYPYLSTADKATIRKVFLRWVDENLHAEITGFNHPEPIGLVESPDLVTDPLRVRWAGNNYYTAHMRNIGLMSLALDAADDPKEELRGQLRNATGAWLYVVDHLLRTDAKGGLAPEGFEYSPQSMGYVAQFLLALHTAGKDDPASSGPQASFRANPFWDDMVTAYLQSVSPLPVERSEGPVYLPAWYGDGQNYYAPDFIEAFGPLGIYDALTGNTTRFGSLRWIEEHLAPGGDAGLLDRVRRANNHRDAILYFLLFDPAAPDAADPRPSQPLRHVAPGIGRLFARTGWGPDAAWFTHALGWISVDHQHGDGNQFELYRKGEWLTKERTGYGDNIGASDYHNTLALENDTPEHNDPSDYRSLLFRRGSQWLYGGAEQGPKVVARSLGDGFVFVSGDATNLYNSEHEASTDIAHSSRSILWLEPDHIVVYDRAESKTAGRFKRFWLNLPAEAKVSGKRSSVTTPKGQQLVVTTLLPAGAAPKSERAEPLTEQGEPANDEPMQFRLRVDAPGDPVSARFLHALQGADSGVRPDDAVLIESTGGTPSVGVAFGSTAVMFPVDLAVVDRLVYTAPTSATRHLVTGLAPDAGYDVTMRPVSGGVEVTVGPGAERRADAGGVLDLRV